MLKLNAGLSRKVGEPDFSSRGASVNLELEVEGHLIQDTDALHDRIRRLFALARQAVDEELRGGRAIPSAPRGEGTANGNGSSPARKATAAQHKAILAICDRLQIDAEETIRGHCGVSGQDLTLRDASTLIDELKARQAAPAGRGP